MERPQHWDSVASGAEFTGAFGQRSRCAVLDLGSIMGISRFVPTSTPKALVVLAHGMMEHRSRYGELGEFLAENEFLVVAPDFPGHGPGQPKQGWGVLDAGTRWEDFATVLRDIVQKTASPRTLPVFLLGHSMGGFVVLDLLENGGVQVTGAILTGPTIVHPALATLGRWVAGVQCAFGGRNTPSALLHIATFGPLNAGLEGASPNRWICSDHDVVTDYDRDPGCGFQCSAGFFRELFRGVSGLFTSRSLRKIPSALPMLLIAGEFDALSANGIKGEQLTKRLRQTGHPNVVFMRVEGARHEVLKERSQVETFIAIRDWILATLSLPEP